MAHPQSSARGYFAKNRIDVGTQSVSANSTGIIMPTFRVGTKAFYFTSNSTGVLLNSKYISCNSTGNATT
jgi:hypothetical protein